MSNLYRISFCCLILVLCQIRWGYCGEKEDEQNANTVFIRYNEVTVERWGKDPEDTGIDNTQNMKMTVAELVQDYCASNIAECSLASSGTFTKSDVVLSSQSPSAFNGDVKISFYVSIENNDVATDGDTMYALPKAALTTICEEGAVDLGKASNGNWTVDFVNDKRVSAPLDDTLDKIIIPLCIILVIAFGVFALVMNRYHQNQEKQHLPTGNKGDVVLTAVKDDDKERGGKSDDEPGADEGLLKGQEGGGAVNA